MREVLRGRDSEDFGVVATLVCEGFFAAESEILLLEEVLNLRIQLPASNALRNAGGHGIGHGGSGYEGARREREGGLGESVS